MEIEMSIQDFLDYIKDTKAKNTFKMYRRGIQTFSEWYGKTPDQILEERRQDWISGNLHQKKRFTREIERFHKAMIEKGYAINTATSLCLGIIQLFRFFEMPVTIPTGSDVSKTVVSTKDFVPAPQQYREMYRVADNLRDKLTISMAKDLAWRIGDFLSQRKDELPNLDQDAPIAYDLITEKEDVVAKSFISGETVQVLKAYLPTLPEDNPYLFPSTNGTSKPITPETLNRTLKALAEKAKIVVPRRKRLRFHAFRKRFLSTCANLGIDINIAKILVGKDVESDMLTYLSEVEHRKAFIKVRDVLRLTEISTSITKPTSELEKRVRDLERIIISMVGMGYGEQVREAQKVAKVEGIKIEMQRRRKLSLREKLEEMKRRGDEILRKLEEQEKVDEAQRKEYAKIIEENNNND